MVVVAGDCGRGTVTRRVAVKEAPVKIAGRPVHVLSPAGGQYSMALQTCLPVTLGLEMGQADNICAPTGL